MSAEKFCIKLKVIRLSSEQSYKKRLLFKFSRKLFKSKSGGNLHAGFSFRSLASFVKKPLLIKDQELGWPLKAAAAASLSAAASQQQLLLLPPSTQQVFLSPKKFRMVAANFHRQTIVRVSN